MHKECCKFSCLNKCLLLPWAKRNARRDERFGACCEASFALRSMVSEALLLSPRSCCRMLHLGCKRLSFRPQTYTSLRGTRPGTDCARSAGSNATASSVKLQSATDRSTLSPLLAPSPLLQTHGMEKRVTAKRKVAVFVAYVGSSFRDTAGPTWWYG